MRKHCDSASTRTDTATTTFIYDNRGRLTRTTDALGQSEILTYNTHGLLLTKTDRNGTVFHHTYDGMGRLTKQEARQNNVVTRHNIYTFTATGALREITNGSHTITNSYDAQGRLERQEEGAGTVGGGRIIKTYTHNTANNRTSSRIEVSNNIIIDKAYTYNSAQRLHTVRSNNELISTDTYDANGALSSTTLGNGVITTYTRNLSGLPTNVANRNGNTTISSFNYTYHLDGNVSQITETMSGVTRTINYTYDTARRLTREQSTGGGTGAITRQYEFDNRGNRARMIVTGAETYTVNYTYDLNNRLLTEARTGASPGTTNYTYDHNGNQLTQTAGNQTKILTYNAFNQQDSVTANGESRSITYRADGLRLRGSSTSSGTMAYVWDGSHNVLTLNITGVVTNIYTRTPGGRLIRSQHHGWYLYNARGDVVQRTDNSRNILHNYRYTAFGMDLGSNANSTNPFRFAGEYWEAHSGTYYLRARNYNPRTGRFLSPDPFWNTGNMTDSPLAILQAANLYVYTMNNPIRWIDPSGLKALDPTTQALRDRFIATEYGGRVNAREYALSQGATVTNLNGGGINISHNGISQNFNLNNNGTLSFNALNSIFNWNAGFALNAYSERMEIHAGTFHHVPYTTMFRSKNNVILAWSLHFYPLSELPDGREQFSWIYRHISGFYTYGVPSETWTARSVSASEINNCPDLTRIGSIHTHTWHALGNPRAYEHFSSQFDGPATRASGVPGYLITSRGDARRLCNTWAGGGVIYPHTNIISNDSSYVSFLFNIFGR